MKKETMSHCVQKMGRDIFYIYVFIAISLSCCSTHRKESGEERVAAKSHCTDDHDALARR